MSVALGHCCTIIGGPAIWASSVRDFGVMSKADILLRLVSSLFPADAAVMVFFVLSGHVLWTSFQRKDMRFFADLPDYVSARMYRLFPLAIMSALPLALLTNTAANASAKELVMNMLLLHRNLNGVLWSLQVEVVASLLLFAVWGLTRGNPWRLLCALFAAVAAVPFFRGNPYVVFMPAFIIGASISLIPARVWEHGWVLGVGMTALVMTSLLIGTGGASRCFEILGATVLVGTVAAGRLRMLRSRVCLFLGAISYPFYLVHPIGAALGMPLVDFLPLQSPFLRILALAITSVPIAIPLAWLLHVFVEDPVLRARPRFALPGAHDAAEVFVEADDRSRS